MRTLDRYIGREVLLATTIAVAVLSLVLILGNISRRLLDLLVNHQVPFELIVSFVAYVLPFSLTFTIPWGFITAVLIVFGRMSADYEITAARAGGISLERLALPVMVVAFSMSMICLWINLAVAPAAQQTMRTVLFDIAVNNPLALFGSDQIIDEFPGRRIYVGHRDGSALYNLQVVEIDEEGRPLRVLHARRGSIEADLKEQRILLHLEGALYEERDRKNPSDLSAIRHGITGSGTFPVSLEELQSRSRTSLSLGSLTLQELRQSLQRDPSAKEESALRTEISKRFSMSFACVAFAAVAVPLAIGAGRRETSLGFIFGLVVAFSYFGMLIFAESQRNNPALHPELLAWLPNVIFILLGGALFIWRRR